MASQVPIRIDPKGLEQLRMDPALQQYVLEVADGVAHRAGDGYEARKSESSKTRARAYVEPVTAAAREEAAADPSILIHALGGGLG